MTAIRAAVALFVLTCTAIPAAAVPKFPKFPGGGGQGMQTGILRGVVTDEQNLAVPGVTITVSSPALQGMRATVTATDGTYVFRQLPAGTYQVRIELSGFRTETRNVVVPLGVAAEQNVLLRPQNVETTVEVTGTAQPLENPSVGINIRQTEVEALATSRTLQGITTLSPAVNDNTPNAGQVAINGAFAFDNLFMINGVDVNDNLFGSPQNLFIEDAIEETQVITSGISAEYGRFSGGVINAITKSGGNNFSGSFRVNFTNPAWVQETPFEKDNDVTRESNLNRTYEMTFGGPILRDKIWFFGAGRIANLITSQTFDTTGIPYSEDDTNRRAEGKVTATLAPGHSAQVGFLNNSRKIENAPSFDFSIEPATQATQNLPNWYTFANYRGTVKNNFLAEAQYSERRYKFDGVGGTSTNIFDSPFITLSQDLGHYNAPYFDATDPEERNNRQITGNVTYLLGRGGRHELKAGYEWFRSQNRGGNSQSATGYVFDADYVTDANDEPLLDAEGRLSPVFVPGETQIENWIAVRGATLNIDNNSLYAQDHWIITRQLSADVGLRYERVRSKATGNIVGVDTDSVVPRFALSYDVAGDGKYVIHTTYGHYSGRYTETQVGDNTNVGNPDETIGVYTGPAGSGRNFAPGFDPANYDIIFGDFPTVNVFYEDGLTSALTKEFTVSGGVSAGAAYAEATYIWRNTSNFIEDFTEASNGATEVIRDGINYGTFTNRIFRNSDLPERHFQSLVFQGRYRVRSQWSAYGAWTIQLQNEGNYEGEASNQPGLTSVIGDYPEAFDPARNFPMGRLASFQRHRVRLWSIYDFDLGKAGSMSASGLWRFESGRAYSLVSTNRPLTAIQEDLLSAYVDLPDSQSIYFGPRGSETFPYYSLFDFSLNYAIPIFKTLRPWVKADLFNAFNNDKLVGFNTTVSPDPASPLDALGLPTGYIKSANFGKARSANDFPRSLATSGGRTFRMSVGFRF